MKLTLDLSHPKLPKLFWLALVLVSLWTVIWQMPASWVGGILTSQTGCRVMLQQPTGTIWDGSAALAFSETNASEGGCRDPHAVTERFLTCNLKSIRLDFASLADRDQCPARRALHHPEEYQHCQAGRGAARQ